MKSPFFNAPALVFCISFSLQFIGTTALKAQLQWTQVQGIYSGEVNDMIVHPANGNVLLNTGSSSPFKWYRSNNLWKPMDLNYFYGIVPGCTANGAADDVYYGWSNQVFYTHDFGESWMFNAVLPAGTGFIVRLCGTQDGRVLAIAASPTGAIFPEIFLSSDRGVSWTPFPSNIDFYPEVIIYDEQNNIFIAGSNKGVSKSADNGVTWVSMNSGDMTESVSVSQLHLVRPTGTLLASTFLQVFRSIDGGQSWQQLPGNFQSGNFDHDDSGHIYKAGRSIGLYVSTDDGLNWTTRKETGMPDELDFVKAGTNNDLFCSGSDNAGLLLYDENSQVWVKKGLPQYAVNSIFPVPNSSVVMAATYDTLFRSSDKGMTWNRSNQGINHPFFDDLGAYGNEITAMNLFDGFYFSSDSGQSWTAPTGSFPNLASSMVSTNANKIFLTSFGDVQFSPNKGVSWGLYMQGLPAEADPDKLIFIQRDSQPGYLYCIFAFGKVYRTRINNLTANWQPYYNGLPDNLLFDIYGSKDGNILLTTTQNKLFVSGTLSDQWTEVPYPPIQSNLNTLFAFDETRWIAGTESGLYFTTNGGQSWQSGNIGLADRRIRCIQVNQDGLLMVGTEEGGIFYTDDLLSSTYMPVHPLKQFSFWPNPSSDRIMIDGIGENVTGWNANDVFGRKIPLELHRVNNQMHLNIQNLTPGVWWISAPQYQGKMLIKK
jgi:photosystem II stability/assembly factor-like uncharacterized protein